MAPLRFASISGSHANMAARAILHGVAPDSLALGNVSAAWRKSIEEGSSWQVIKRAVVAEFPSLVELICQAGNSLQAVSKSEDEMQLLQKILKVIQLSKGASPKWQDISAEVLRSRPKCAASAAGIFAFLIKYGGSDKLLQGTEVHVRNFGRANRELGPEVWMTLSQDIKGLAAHLHWRHMLLKFAYCNPDRPLGATDAARTQTWAGR